MISLGTALVGLFAALLVIRHTRADEELGRQELLAGGSVGRMSQLAAALVVAALASTAVGVSTAASLVGTGLATGGSVALGLSWLSVGVAFAGVGAVAAQLTTSARAARALAVGALAVAYLLRAVGDAVGDVSEPAWPSWLSPVGWAQQIRPYAGDRFLISLLPVTFAAALVGLAGVLSRHRDVGSGLLPQRHGPARAPRSLAGPMGLAWRLQRTAFVGWLTAFVLLSLVLAQILTRIGDALDSPVARQLITALGGVDQMTEAFLAVELSFIAVFASAYGISSVLHLAAEESAARADLILTNPVSRVRWGYSHLILALVGTGLLMVACGLSIGLVQVAQTGELHRLSSDLAVALVRLPAVWVMIGVATALYGWSRRATPAAWIVLVASFLASEFGPILDVPNWVRDLSPFSHVPLLTPSTTSTGPVVVLLAVAAVLVATGLWGLRHRDLTTA